MKLKFKKYLKTVKTEMIQVTKDNVDDLKQEVQLTALNPIFTYDEDGYIIGNLESNGFFSPFGSYLVREILPNGKCNYYPIAESIQNLHYKEI